MGLKYLHFSSPSFPQFFVHKLKVKHLILFQIKEAFFRVSARMAKSAGFQQRECNLKE